MRRLLLALALVLTALPASGVDDRAVKTKGQFGAYGVFNMCVSQTAQAICTNAAGHNIVLDFDGGGWNRGVYLNVEATNSTATAFSCILKTSESTSASTLAGTLGTALTQSAPSEGLQVGVPFVVWVDCSAAAITGGGSTVNIDMKVTPISAPPGSE